MIRKTQTERHPKYGHKFYFKLRYGNNLGEELIRKNEEEFSVMSEEEIANDLKEWRKKHEN